MKNAWLVATSALRWAIALPVFGLQVGVVILSGAIFGQRRNDWMLSFFARTILLITGARVRAQLAPGYDPERVCFYVVNHVNLFDPFVLYPAIPTFFRGLELESHFKIPFYGWMMKSFGNVPVPDVRSASALKKTYRLAGEALEKGTNLVVFAEGSRTLDGRVGPFESGVFRMALQLGYPIVPVSIVDAFRWQRKGSLLLRPTRITVIVHELIETKGLDRKDLRDLAERVHTTDAAPVHAALDARGE
jgi:1-acyl-sn-glycerol-3-phosphate acyltransferase